MATLIPTSTQSSSTIQSYSDLVTAVSNWAHRTDVSTIVPDAIAFAETKFSRRLRVRQMEALLSATSIASNLITRPTDLVAVKALWNTDTYKSPIEAKPLEFVANTYNGGSTAVFYAWDRDYFRFDAATGEVGGVYYEAIDSLESATTNWLLDMAPDLYLSASLAELFLYLQEEDRAAMWESRTNARIDELNLRDQKDRMSGQPLTVRTR